MSAITRHLDRKAGPESASKRACSAKLRQSSPRRFCLGPLTVLTRTVFLKSRVSCLAALSRAVERLSPEPYDLTLPLSVIATLPLFAP